MSEQKALDLSCFFCFFKAKQHEGINKKIRNGCILGSGSQSYSPLSDAGSRSLLSRFIRSFMLPGAFYLSMTL